VAADCAISASGMQATNIVRLTAIFLRIMLLS
jgi:hypothetical protein